MKALAFLKLGGSLITEKGKPSTARTRLMDQLAKEIAEARSEDPGLRLLVGHGSGSFGHVPAREHGTRAGVESGEDWLGFAEVYAQASALNHLVMQALQENDVRARTFSPSASVLARAGQIESWDTAPLTEALKSNLLPVVYGDAAFDRQRGGTILSTEELFIFLADRLKPQRILLAGEAAGVFEDYPQQERLIAQITPQSFPHYQQFIAGSAQTDVTGGMSSKVETMVALVKKHSGLEVSIFSAKEPGALKAALSGEAGGTKISSA